jgi:hypothetical protein
MPYIPPIQTWDLLDKNRDKSTSINYTRAEEVKKEMLNKNTNIRGKRSKIILVPDSKEYYKGIKIIQWYWYKLIYKIKKLLHKGE